MSEEVVEQVCEDIEMNEEPGLTNLIPHNIIINQSQLLTDVNHVFLLRLFRWMKNKVWPIKFHITSSSTNHNSLTDVNHVFLLRILRWMNNQVPSAYKQYRSEVVWLGLLSWPAFNYYRQQDTNYHTRNNKNPISAIEIKDVQQQKGKQQHQCPQNDLSNLYPKCKKQ